MQAFGDEIEKQGVMESRGSWAFSSRMLGECSEKDEYRYHFGDYFPRLFFPLVVFLFCIWKVIWSEGRRGIQI